MKHPDARVVGHEADVPRLTGRHQNRVEVDRTPCQRPAVAGEDREDMSVDVDRVSVSARIDDPEANQLARTDVDGWDVWRRSAVERVQEIEVAVTKAWAAAQHDARLHIEA